MKVANPFVLNDNKEEEGSGPTFCNPLAKQPGLVQNLNATHQALSSFLIACQVWYSLIVAQ